jgi:hypothetical protein
MKTKKIKFKEGQVFAVPLRQGGYVLGILVREYIKITLGYFFNKIYPTIPDKVDKSEISIDKIALIALFSSMGIEDGYWPLVETNLLFKKGDWPIPLMKMQDPLTEKYYSVLFDETLINDERKLISEEIAQKLFDHSLHGYVSLEKKVSTIMANSNS